MKVSTKLNAASEKKDTELTIVWDGMDAEDIKALAQQALIVKWQGQKRRDESIPDAETIKAVDYKVGTRAPKKSLAEQVEGMSSDDRAALIEKLLAMQSK